ncbi:MAG: LLM class F420-dependent oxidoreductase [Candidatus Binataceae bacterium]
MKIGIFVGIAAGARPDSMATVAQHAERLNFGTLWAGEHVVVFDSYESKYPYTEDGAMPLARDADFLDPIVALTYAAAVTRNIRLATGICLVPEHNPIVLAKQIASLDYLSAGRFALGIGIGWSEEEFKAVGVPFERRAQRTCEYLEAMRKLWSEEHASFAGEFVRFDAARMNPKPVAKDQMPIYFGGESLPALKRVAKYGTGWFGSNLGPLETAEKLVKLRALMKANGRNPEGLRVMMSPGIPHFSPSNLAKYRDAGVDELVIFLNYSAKQEENIGKLEHLAKRWVEPAAKLG